MKVKSCMTLILALVVTNSLADEPEAVQGDASTAPLIDLEQQQIVVLNQESGLEIPADELLDLESPPKLSGEWIEKDGVLECDGYLTRMEEEEFCAAEVPSDWQPFDYDGMTYYVQPIKDK
ncbi:MAG: hypothetical protein WBN09_11450 [Woeseiaceae bacterium]